MTDKVQFTLIANEHGKYIGHARLNKVKALNALDMDMIEALAGQLLSWQKDDSVVAVLLDGEGPKAFCAGGDVVSLYQALIKNDSPIPAAIEGFFSAEYRLDHLIHTYTKPVICWGNGIVMGGGLGLFSGASHRIVTETSRIAMPEITIGLYPDVGASWFLNRMPAGVGLFLGLTGANINAMDAIHIKLADYFIPQAQQALFIEQLKQLKLGQTLSLNQQKVSDLCHQLHSSYRAELPASHIKPHEQQLAPLAECDDIGQVMAKIAALPSDDDKWLQKAQATMQKGSVLSAAVFFEQLKRSQSMTLAECFRMELMLSCRIAPHGEFQEGVRALLVDKDQQPQWRYQHVEEITPQLLEHCFSSPWPADQHPLAALGK